MSKRSTPAKVATRARASSGVLPSGCDTMASFVADGSTSSRYRQTPDASGPVSDRRRSMNRLGSSRAFATGR
jgi:hypothetical protein